jgi:putative heme-binding domain-containing protein
VFWSDEAACAKCHVAHGSGGKLGPDLSNLVDRDYESVLRDIAHPDAAINPDYITYQVVMRDGRALIGTIQSDGDRLLIGDREGRVTELPQEDVDSMRPATVSTMPSGLAEKLGPEKMKHLLAFLLQPPPRMTGAEAGQSGLPPESTLQRSRPQVAELIEMDRPRDAGNQHGNPK